MALLGASGISPKVQLRQIHPSKVTSAGRWHWIKSDCNSISPGSSSFWLTGVGNFQLEVWCSEDFSWQKNALGYLEEIRLWREGWSIGEQSKMSPSWAGDPAVDVLQLVKVSFERTRCPGVTWSRVWLGCLDCFETCFSYILSIIHFLTLLTNI